MKPKVLLDKLKETVSPKAIKTLDAIYEICLEQEKRGVYDFSVATIARLGYKRGVPKAQSLRNKTGKATERCCEHSKSITGIKRVARYLSQRMAGLKKFRIRSISYLLASKLLSWLQQIKSLEILFRQALALRFAIIRMKD